MQAGWDLTYINFLLELTLLWLNFFPQKLNNVSIDCLSTSINVNHQTMKNFPTYCKNLVQLHKWKISPPEYLIVDIKCDGDASSPVKGTGSMIVYGISGTHNDVDSAVFDRLFVIQQGNMLMETGTDMSYQILKNLPDPTGDFQAARKKYVDDKTVTKLDHSGGSMLGDIDTNSNSITNLAYPTNQADAATKQYTDISGIFSILNSATATYVDGYIKQNAECLYSCERELPSEARFTPSTRAISTLFDQTLSGLNATQSVVARRPKLSTGKNATRFFFTFDGVDDRMISNINLNPASGKADIVHVFILFRLKSHSGPDAHFRNGLVMIIKVGISLFVTDLPVTLVTTGSIVGGVTMNPIVLGILSGLGVLLKTAMEMKNLQKKIQNANVAFTAYAKVLSDLRNFLRGEE